ncbi:MAG: redox-sensitive bicupin YhaK (pirin superfamily) [Planctomycetota bacterium]|jgi:redox-sensitive bicupin YhaK (pirin superfamily)
MSTQKTVLSVLPHASNHWVGDGFEIRNLFPSNDLGERISPFLLADYFGPTAFSPTQQKRGVGEHPHRGFETVTLLFEGQVAHRDSAGHSGTIGPGDVQWMTAGSGIVHEEFHSPEFSAAGGTFHGVQLWVNLPAKHKLDPPRYQGILAADIPSVDLGSGSHARIIAGTLAGTSGPAQTVTPMNLWDVTLTAGSDTTLELPDGHNSAALLLQGRAKVQDSEPLTDAHIAVLDRAGTSLTITAAENTRLLLLSGEPIHEPVVSHGPFVMNTPAEINQAIRDYQSGKMGRLS